MKKGILLEAEEAAVRGDHDVVQDLDTQELARLDEPDREGSVLLRRGGVSTWMVVLCREAGYVMPFLLTSRWCPFKRLPRLCFFT
jgi:hypothetical protein